MEPSLPKTGKASWKQEMEVSEDELLQARKRMLQRSAAPGPSGVPARAWGAAAHVLGNRLRSLFTECLRRGYFPRAWRGAKLVLLRKPGKPADTAAGYRPICLIVEEAKLLERVILERVVAHLDGRGPNLHARQYDFRRDRSTIDAILYVRGFVERAWEEGEVVVGVCLDIRNAFNSLPWEAIGLALARHRVPLYLLRVLRSYLQERRLQFRADGTRMERAVERGVPQGSILGPLLWDLRYNVVLSETDLPPGCAVVCYADDTIVLAARRNLVANEALHCVVEEIQGLGLQVAHDKTEAVGFHRGGRQASMTVRVAGTDIRLTQHIKYLGLLLDRRLRFEDHFASVAKRTDQAALLLSRLLPNLGGPGGKPRRLFANVVASIALYGSPVWAEEAGKRPTIQRALRGAQRRIAGRAVKAYKTVSHAVNTALAGSPPLELMAAAQAEVYRAVSELKERHGHLAVTPSFLHQVRGRCHNKLLKEWERWISTTPQQGDETLRAIQSRLKDWSEAKVGLFYRATQILTGHGCFGKYLRRIGKEITERCWHCTAPQDTASLQLCPTWAVQRARLRAEIGQDLSMDNVVRALLTEKGAKAFLSFAEEVIQEKERHERARREIPPARMAS